MVKKGCISCLPVNISQVWGCTGQDRMCNQLFTWKRILLPTSSPKMQPTDQMSTEFVQWRAPSRISGGRQYCVTTSWVIARVGSRSSTLGQIDQWYCTGGMQIDWLYCTPYLILRVDIKASFESFIRKANVCLDLFQYFYQYFSFFNSNKIFCQNIFSTILDKQIIKKGPIYLQELMFTNIFYR